MTPPPTMIKNEVVSRTSCISMTSMRGKFLLLVFSARRGPSGAFSQLEVLVFVLVLVPVLNFFSFSSLFISFFLVSIAAVSLLSRRTL